MLWRFAVLCLGVERHFLDLNAIRMYPQFSLVLAPHARFELGNSGVVRPSLTIHAQSSLQEQELKTQRGSISLGILPFHFLAHRCTLWLKHELSQVTRMRMHGIMAGSKLMTCTKSTTSSMVRRMGSLVCSLRKQNRSPPLHH